MAGATQHVVGPAPDIGRRAPYARDRPSGEIRQQRGGQVTVICSSKEFNGLENMLESARRLIVPSARSDVPPFIVMDVMAAAARLETQGGRVVHMEVGQPAAPAPRAA